MSEPDSTPAPEEAPDPSPAPAPRKRRRLRRFLLWSAAALAVFAGIGAAGFFAAESYTARPNFCASCHIMEPYYATWKNDPHGRMNVACIDCHYAPGERSSVNAKMRGLSQVASYFSGRYGSGRPRAHVAQESCMTSSCHGDKAFMDRPLMVGDVAFTHAKHLNHTADKERDSLARLSAVREQIGQLVGDEHLAQLTTEARRMGPAEERQAVLASLCRQWEARLDPALLAEFIQLEHRPVRIAQLQSLQCVDCHANNLQSTTIANASGRHHFSVQTSSCFTCHFNNEGFNTGTGACMTCHEPPQKEITVHQQLSEDVGARLKLPGLESKPVKMDHADIVARKVDCRSCHADVVLGDAIVTRRDCERCHDRAGYFADWTPDLTTDLVTKYHAVHVPQQRAKCLDCHTQIQHQLAPDAAQVAGRGFLSTPLSDCAHCHTDTHQEVLSLLQGHGGTTIPSSEPNMMFGARTNCYGCHTQRGQVNGREVLVATQQACIACHGERYAATFDQWKQVLADSLKEAQANVAKARAALARAPAAPGEARSEAERDLASAVADLGLIQRGNGVHNITYALLILDGINGRCNEVLQLFPEAKPE
jgi:nitrate/TMAO reductase-like tetraheme cytochrome c subunit